MVSLQGLPCGTIIRIGDEIHKIVDKDLTEFGGVILNSPLKRDWPSGTTVGVIQDVEEYEDARDINGQTQFWGSLPGKAEGTAPEVGALRASTEHQLSRAKQKARGSR